MNQNHKERRKCFSENFKSLHFSDVPPIIFTDESTVCVDLKGGVWRKRGEHPGCSFYKCPQKPKSVMVIGPKGWRSDL